MVGHDDEGMQEESSLAAIVEYGSLKQFRRRCDLEKAAALRRDRGDQIRTSFLWGQAHVSMINERPVAKAIPNSKAVFRGLKAPAPSV
jgi:TnpA family transposase